uniref:Uncharacterized protein n=1 Tax=Spongospora subterranea TaxID=70186 RepID=A0A0H5QFV5_9EUKA
MIISIGDTFLSLLLEQGCNVVIFITQQQHIGNRTLNQKDLVSMDAQPSMEPNAGSHIGLISLHLKGKLSGLHTLTVLNFTMLNFPVPDSSHRSTLPPKT